MQVRHATDLRLHIDTLCTGSSHNLNNSKLGALWVVRHLLALLIPASWMKGLYHDTQRFGNSRLIDSTE